MMTDQAAIPSIFNDCIGPVMRGPSSSHTAAAHRIGQLARMLMCERVGRVTVRYDSDGSLATTHDVQGSDIGLMAGLLGVDLIDPRVLDIFSLAREQCMQLDIVIESTGAAHPNTYDLTLHDDRSDAVIDISAISTGGGMIQLQTINGAPVSIIGDSWEYLLLDVNGYASNNSNDTSAELSDARKLSDSEGRTIFWKTSLVQLTLSDDWIELAPVLPAPSLGDAKPKFVTFAEMSAIYQLDSVKASQIAIEYESARPGFGETEVRSRMLQIVKVARESIRLGLAGTEYADRLVEYNSASILEADRQGVLLPGSLMNRTIAYVSALMESKSAMLPIVACPTAGSCGAMPGVLTAAAEELQLDDDRLTDAMLAGSLVSIVIAREATFSAEVAGCQAECGAAGAMAAAGLVELAGGSALTAVQAASMALQNVLGLICDPVASRVEIPCWGRNVHAAVGAIAAANMALAGCPAVLPLDEVVRVMLDVGHQIPRELRCTALGGLSQTETSLRLSKKLNG